jgi:hypothetical protein
MLARVVPIDFKRKCDSLLSKSRGSLARREWRKARGRATVVVRAPQWIESNASIAERIDLRRQLEARPHTRLQRGSPAERTGYAAADLPQLPHGGRGAQRRAADRARHRRRATRDAVRAGREQPPRGRPGTARHVADWSPLPVRAPASSPDSADRRGGLGLTRAGAADATMTSGSRDPRHRPPAASPRADGRTARREGCTQAGHRARASRGSRLCREGRTHSSNRNAVARGDPRHVSRRRSHAGRRGDARRAMRVDPVALHPPHPRAHRPLAVSRGPSWRR